MYVSSSQCISHLSCVHELKRSECDFEVGGVGLEVVESTSDADLELRGVLARWARGRDLIERTHDCGCCRGEGEVEVHFRDHESSDCGPSLRLGQHLF
jgi:hypothetical protein